MNVAIVGMACRYPDASGPAELWQTVLERRTGFRRIPEERLSGAYLGEPGDPDRTYVTHAGVLRGWEFDRIRFGVPGPLHRAADHTHWLALQTAAEALEDAGFTDGAGLARDRVGVVLGNTLTGEFTRAATLRLRWPFLARSAGAALAAAGVPDDQAADVLTRLERAVKQPFPEPGAESLAGALANTIAGRICNHFDFHGFGYTVDGACASSLLAVVTASQALCSGELSFALAGGVDLSLDPFELVGFARLGALARDEMRVYDAEPTGFLPGEGCGVVALMRAEDADRQGLRVYAHLAGWGMSSDGAGGLTRPSVAGQVLALERAYRMAGIRSAALALLEGHGTGTAVGDRVELEALTRVRGCGAAPAALGTVKANIGHTKAAAGVAGLIKSALALHHGVRPPTTGCQRPHEILRVAGAPLRVLDEPEQWTDSIPLAGVSSMGFGGINTHIVLRGRPCPARRPPVPDAAGLRATRAPEYAVVLVGAGSRAELSGRLAALAEHAAGASVAEMHDLACTLFHEAGGSAPLRAGMVAARPEDLADAARHAAERVAGWDGTLVTRHDIGYALGSGSASRVGLLFPGQASGVRAALDPWAVELDIPPLDSGAAVHDGSSDTEVVQPAVIRQSLAGLAWLDALGCQPVAAAGHSLGELTALAWSGRLSRANCLRLAAVRGQLMARYGQVGTTMASLATTGERAAELVRGTTVAVSGYNAPAITTVAGRTAEVAAVLSRAAEQGIGGTVLPVSHAFHSPAMAPVAGPLRAALAEIEWQRPRPDRQVVSTVTGRPLEPAADLVEMLVGQVTSPARFTDAMAHLAGRCDVLVEAGPGTTLTALATTCAAVPTVALDCGGDRRRHAFATAALAVADAADLRRWFAGRSYRPLSITDRPVTLTSPCETDGTAPADRASAAPVTDDPEELLRDHLARLLELPRSAISPASSLLADLHLNSLQVVHAVGAVAELLGRRPPSAPLTLTDATVRDAAAVLAALPDAGSAHPSRAPDGIRGWVRTFGHGWEPLAEDPPAGEPVAWTVHAPDGHWLHAWAASTTGTSGLAAALPDDAGVEQLATLMRRVAAMRPERFLLVHHGHPAAAGIARSVAVELERCAVTVVETPAAAGPRAVAVATSGYRELRLDGDGGIHRWVTRPHHPHGTAEIPLRPGELCLVTGGAAGITAYCAARVAERTGCHLVVLGRSPDDAPGVAIGMARLGPDARYVSCDVADPESVRRALAAVSGDGPVRGLVHGAGLNDPQRLAAVTADSLGAALRPKVDGLGTLLAAVGDQLRLAVAFGSIIGRRGLAGQSEYCVANDWMRHEMEGWAVRHPGCRTHLVEWSLWTTIGMGVRLDVVDSLHRQGVVPIGPEDGAAALLELLTDAAAPVTVLVTSRFPPGPTLAVERAPSRPLRFCEYPRTVTAGVEAILDAELAPGSDPYLDDHRIDGVRVLPAVLGLEAMAQAVTTATGERSRWRITGVRFAAPITVDGRSSRTVRALALDGDNGTEVALRDDADGFVADRFTACVLAEPPEPRPGDAATTPPPDSGPHPWYGSLLFHSGRLRRLVGYDHLSAFRVQAWVRADPGATWFSEFHGTDLVLGDPGAHDATLHALLACAPHRRVLPVGVDELTVVTRPRGPLLVRAGERSHGPDDYTFDVTVTEPDGTVVARWRGLHLHAVGDRPWTEPLPARLVGPFLTRRMIESRAADDVELVTATGLRQNAAAAKVLAGLTGHPVGYDRRGSLTVPGRFASASYTAGHVLVGVSGRPVGLDWQVSDGLGSPFGPATLGARGWQDSLDLAAALGEDHAAAASRVWVAREALVKLGRSPEIPLEVYRITDDGLLISRAEGAVVVTARVQTDLCPAPVAVAVAIEGE